MTDSSVAVPAAGERARFIPGQIIAGRYRVVECAGRGAMGEVYRAQDLKLGLPVALKFLPQEFGRDAAWREAFFSEVRLARQISHPNVCRVHDIEEMGDTHFLSMEFVDGEDLASLLRRIGRVPGGKAVDLAREMCAGLAAIHERGVVHRDFKPANVMIDGRGHARITDFGLAELQGAAVDPDTITGSPAYLAPECLFDGEPPTVRSDLYSLGLVLYEMFTGRRAFDAASLPELIRQRRERDPVSPSKYVSDMNLAVERVIMQCLEKDREKRPATALAVAEALPGDALTTAIAADETPSPEVVAAAQKGPEGLAPAAAWTCLAALIAGLLLVVMLSPHTRLVPALPMPEPPEAMAGRARALLQVLGYHESAADRAYGYEFEERAIDHIVAADHSPSRWNALARARPPVATFWYRESPAAMAAADRWQRVTYSDPPLILTGMAGLQLDGLGRLRRLDSVPVPDLARAAPTPFDVAPLFRAAGLDTADFRAIEPGAAASAAGDVRAAYLGHYAESPELPVRVDVAARGGRAISFAVAEPWMLPGGGAAAPPDPSERITAIMLGSVRPALFLIAMLLGAWLARRNLRAGRGDTKRALRVASGMMAFRVLFWVLGGHHTLATVTPQFMAALAWGFYDFAYGGILYIAVEPYARRLWPRMLTSWVRVLDGQHADPRVGRDLLIGCLLGTMLALLVAAHQAAPALLGAAPGRPDNAGYVEHQLSALLGLRHQIAELLWLYRSAFVHIMGFVVILVVARLILRDARAAIITSFLIFVPLALPRGEFPALNLALAIVSMLLLVVVMLRFGLFAAGMGLLTHATLQSTALGMDMSAWPASRTVLVVLLVLGAGAYGFARSLKVAVRS